MPRPSKNVTPLELYIDTYLRTTSRKQIGLNYIRKALALVNEKLGIPCCDDPGATINLYTRVDNQFTTTVQSMLALLPKAGNVKSLNRIKRTLDTFLNPPCCA